jgi:1,5-anhydro-D-fructose reductase (1,5-anhydro-D-mannitol-forming)
MLKVGIIGYGKVGKTRHSILNKIKGVEVISICDINIKKKKIKSAVTTKKASQIINNKLIDIVFICLPTYLNAEYTIKCLKKQKHVFCEKPPAINAKQLREVIKIEKKNNLKLMYGFNHRLHQSVQDIKKYIDSMKFGKILWMRGRYGKSVDRNFLHEWRSKKKYSGGGILIDQGIHMLDLFLYLGNNFNKIKSSISNLYWNLDVEDNAFIILENTKSRISASLHSTMTQWRHLFSLEIFMEKGYFVLNGLKTSSNSYGKEVLTIAKNRSLPPAASWTKEINKEYRFDNSFKIEINNFIKSVKNDKPILTSNSKDALAIMKIIDKIYKNK